MEGQVLQLRKVQFASIVIEKCESVQTSIAHQLEICQIRHLFVRAWVFRSWRTVATPSTVSRRSSRKVVRCSKKCDIAGKCTATTIQAHGRLLHGALSAPHDIGAEAATSKAEGVQSLRK